MCFSKTKNKSLFVLPIEALSSLSLSPANIGHIILSY